MERPPPAAAARPPARRQRLQTLVACVATRLTTSRLVLRLAKLQQRARDTATNAVWRLTALLRQPPQWLRRIDRVTWYRVGALCASVTAVSLAVFLLKTASSVGLSLSLGLFGSLATALTFVLASSLRTSAWADLSDQVLRTPTIEWFIASLAAIALAACESLSISASRQLAIASVVLSLVGGIYGLWALYEVLRIGLGAGRERFLGSLLARDIRRHTTDSEPPLSAQRYLDAVMEALVRGDAIDTRNRLAEVDDAAARLERWKDKRAIVSLMSLHVDLLARIIRAVFLGQIASEVPTFIDDVVRGLLRTADALSRVDIDRAGREEGDRVIAVHLGSASRLLGWAGLLASRAPSSQQAALVGVAAAVRSARRQVRKAADPNPPAHYIESGDVHFGGVRTPEAAVIWAWGHLDFGSRLFEAPLYVLYDVFAKRRFSRRLSEGADVFSAIDSDVPASSHGRHVLDLCGGVERLALDLSTHHLATSLIVARTWPEERLGAHLRGFALPDRPRASSDDALTLLARLLADRSARASAYPLVRSAYGGLSRRIGLPLLSPAQRPGSAILATACRTLPMEEGPVDQTRRFLSALPPRLLGEAVDAAAMLFDGKSTWHLPVDLSKRQAVAAAIIDELRVVWV